MAQVDVILAGVVAGEEDILVPRLAKLLRRDEATIRSALARCPFRCLKNVDAEKAEQVRSYLEAHGGRVELRPVEGASPVAAVAEEGSSGVAAADARGATPGAADPEESARRDASSDSDPYKAPQSDLHGGAAEALHAHDPDSPPQALNFARRFTIVLDLMKRNFWNLIGIQLVAFLGLIIVGIVVGGGVFLLAGGFDLASLEGADPSAAAAQMAAAPLVLVVMLIGAVLLTAVVFMQQAAFLRVAGASFETGGRAPFWACVRNGLGRAAALAAGGGWVFFVPLMLGVVVFAGVVAAMGQGGGVVALLIPLFMVLALVFFLISALVFPAAVLEPASGLAAFKRGWALAVGRRKVVVGNMLLVVLLLLVLVVVVGLAVQGISELFLELGQIGAVLVGLVNLIVNLVLNTVAYFLVAGFQSLMYYEARVIDDHWLPAWEEVPDLSWPTRGPGSDAVPSAGLKPWLELVLLGVLGVLGLMLVGFVVGISAA